MYIRRSSFSPLSRTQREHVFFAAGTGPNNVVAMSEMMQNLVVLSYAGNESESTR